MLQRKSTKPNWSDSSPVHQEMMKLQGNERYSSWMYNVEDRFKDKTTEEIRQILRETAFPYAVMMENWAGDFNCSSLVRNANAFNAREVFYVGDKRIDRRGMVGCQNYTDFHWLPTIDDLLSLKSRYTFVGVDNIDGAKSIREVEYLPNTLFIFGSEGTGLTSQMRSVCDSLIYIEQFGSIRSINAAVASGIIMNDFVSKWRDRKI